MTEPLARIYFQLTKVDLEKREVWGRATEEIPDKTQEIFDYESSKPLFEKWSQDAFHRSALPGVEPSLGNVREMHGEIAAGKIIDLQFNDAEKAIDIGTYCADDGTWGKILKGVLTGFSIGGRYARRWMDRSLRLTRYTADPVEISYVDVPAVPTATFALVKADGSMEMKKVGEPVVEPTVTNDDAGGQVGLDVVRSGEEVKAVPTIAGLPSPTVINNARGVQPVSHPLADPIEKDDAPQWVDDFRGDLQEFARAIKDLSAIKVEANDRKAELEKQLRLTGNRVGIARKANAPLVAPNGQPGDSALYADPANWSWLCDEKGHTTAVEAYNKADGLARYTDQEARVLGRRIARLASRWGEPFRYSPQTRKIYREVNKMGQPNELVKVELEALMSQVQSEVDVAADKLGIDPAAFRALLASALAEVQAGTVTAAADVGAAEPTPPTGEQTGADVTALKADAPATTGATTPAPTGSSASASTPATTAVTSPASSGQTAAKTADDGASGGGAIARPEVASTPDAFADMAGKVNKLAEQFDQIIAKLGGAAAPAGAVAKMDKPSPAGDLATLLSSIGEQKPTDDPVLKALTSGDVDAALRAAQLAGSVEAPDARSVLEKAQKAAQDSLLPKMRSRAMARGWYGADFLSGGEDAGAKQ